MNCSGQCKGCPSLTSAPMPRPSHTGPIAVVLDWPTEREVKKQESFQGPRGGALDLLYQSLASHVDIDDVYVTYAANCQLNPKKKAMHKKAMLACRDRLVAELLEAGVDKVLCTGPIGYGALAGSKVLPAITNVRGRWEDWEGGLFMGTLPPGFAIGKPEYFVDIAYDLDKFFNTDGRPADPDVTMWWPESIKELDEAFDFLYQFQYVAMDLETTGFSPVTERPLAAGLGVIHEDGESATVVVITEALLEQRRTWRRIQNLINGDMEVVFHNAKFDLQHIHSGLERFGLDYEPANIHDTMMLNYARDERPMGKYKPHSLEKLARLRYDAPDYGIGMGEWLKRWEHAEGDIREGMRHEMHIYMSLDVYYTARLYPDIWNELLDEDEDLLEQYERIFMPGTIALADVERHGILLDRAMYERSRGIVEGKAQVLMNRIKEITGKDDFNPGSWQQVEKLIYGEYGCDLKVALEAAASEVTLDNISARDEGIRSRGTYTDPSRLKSSKTAAPVLKMIARGYPEHRELIDAITEWRNLTKNAGTYIKGLLARMDADDRIRGSFNIHGTASGRLSSTNPNLQNLPPASHTGIAVRSGFMAPPGYSLLDCDYKQLEVRIAAICSHDENMREMFAKGGDPHAETSYRIYGKHEVSHYERMLGKIITFGLLYGRSPDSIATGPEAEDIVARGGKRWAPEDVREFFSNLLGNWHQYAEWRAECQKKPYQDGEIKFSIGRKRRFHFIPKHDGGHAGRQGINTPCQGTASDFCFWALIQLHSELKPYRAQVVATVHDSILVECHDDDLEVVVPLVQEIMEKRPLWETDVPLAVDLKLCKRWGEEDDTQYAAAYVTYGEAEEEEWPE